MSASLYDRRHPPNGSQRRPGLVQPRSRSGCDLARRWIVRVFDDVIQRQQLVLDLRQAWDLHDSSTSRLRPPASSTASAPAGSGSLERRELAVEVRQGIGTWPTHRGRLLPDALPQGRDTPAGRSERVHGPVDLEVK